MMDIKHSDLPDILQFAISDMAFLLEIFLEEIFMERSGTNANIRHNSTQNVLNGKVEIMFYDVFVCHPVIDEDFRLCCF